MNQVEDTKPPSSIAWLFQTIFGKSEPRRAMLELCTCTKGYCLFDFAAKRFEFTENINLYDNANFFKCITHLQNKHSNQFNTDSASYFEANLSVPNKQVSIIRHFTDLYYIDFEVIPKADKVCLKVIRFNSNNYLSRLDRYAIEFQNGDSTHVKYGCVRLKRNINDKPMETSIDSIRSVFGENINIIITIESFVTCKKCHNVIARLNTESKFLLKAGWHCLNCAETVRTCGHMWQDCQFMDVEEKQKKHRLFFCLSRKICYICRRSVRSENGGPIAHYRDNHQSITYMTEVMFRLNSSKDSQYCLLDHQGDLMVCRYRFDDNEFYFAIRSPWQQEQIKQLRCYMTLKPVVDSESLEPEIKTYEMQRSLDCFDDWQIDLKKWTFNNWDCVFDVFIKLERILV